MSIAIHPYRHGTFRDDADAVVTLWNAAARENYGFFPLTRELFLRRIVLCRRFDPGRLLLAADGEEVVGMLHFDLVTEPHYPHCGVIEAVTVAPDHRRGGIATLLMTQALDWFARQGIDCIDGLGSWPYTPFYTTLIDGSERSGAFLDDAASLALFERFGFARRRESLVMELRFAATERYRQTPAEEDTVLLAPRRSEQTWLDFVFRGWQLHDHAVMEPGRSPISRAIFARMNGLSDYRGSEEYALFGVHTVHAKRRRRWAGRNLEMLLAHVRGRGAERVELHVYADNAAAVKLYEKLGFAEIARTVMLRREPA